jgi:hypothetical protein
MTMLLNLLDKCWRRAVDEKREQVAQIQRSHALMGQCAKPMNSADLDVGKLYCVVVDWPARAAHLPARPGKWYRSLAKLALGPYDPTGVLYDSGVVLVPNSSSLARTVAELAVDKCGANSAHIYTMAQVAQFDSDLLTNLKALDAEYADGDT